MTGQAGEQRAIRRLIAEIDELDRNRNAVGRRIIAIALCGYACALSLLAWAATH
jgi:hypothetical protein